MSEKKNRLAEYKCLVVDDSMMMRKLIVWALSRLNNLIVVEANNGIDGLKKIAAAKFDLFIVEINMPIMDGLEFIKHIRTNSLYKKTPIIVVTTEGSKDDRLRASQLGVLVS